MRRNAKPKRRCEGWWENTEARRVAVANGAVALHSAPALAGCSLRRRICWHETDSLPGAP